MPIDEVKPLEQAACRTNPGTNRGGNDVGKSCLKYIWVVPLFYPRKAPFTFLFAVYFHQWQIAVPVFPPRTNILHRGRVWTQKLHCSYRFVCDVRYCIDNSSKKLSCLICSIRLVRVIVNGSSSKVLRLHNGFAQGGVCSTDYFNLYISDMVATTSRKFGFADDLGLGGHPNKNIWRRWADLKHCGWLFP